MRRQQERVWHNITPNEVTRIPRRHVFIDTESRIAKRGKTGRQTWRLAVACFSNGRKGYQTRHEWKDYKAASDLWSDVSDFLGTKGRVVVWAHNLGHDARIAGVFRALPALGFNLVAHSINARNTWLEWRKGKATLLMVDSVAFFNTTIAHVGEWHGIGKPAIELDSDSEHDWFTRCRADVRILQTAVEAYLNWLESEDMGNFQVTGAAQSYAVYRHKFLTHKLTVHNDTDALAAERRAMWTGRCEAYWHGELIGERVYEFDFKAAYPRIARDYALPCKLLGQMPPGFNWKAILSSTRTALLARVRIDTEVPVVPASINGRILWPTGTFETTLWDVEIQEAISAGARVIITDGWLYRKAPILKQWGEWVLSEIDKPDDVVAAWKKAIIKHWSRALIGRFAMTYNNWEEFGTMPTPGVMRSILYDSATGKQTEIMQVGTMVWQDLGRVEWQNSMPMITGYVQAIGRVHLWQIMQQLPEGSLIYVDTDSLLTTGKYVREIERIASSFKGGELRLKRAWDGFSVFGPRQIVTGEQVRISGVPRIAERVDRTHYRGEVWDTLGGALRSGAIDTVTTRDREWEVKGVDNRRSGTGFGWTKPIKVAS